MNWRVAAWAAVAFVFALLICAMPLCCGYGRTCGPEWLHARIGSSESGTTALNMSCLLCLALLLLAVLVSLNFSIESFRGNKPAHGAPDDDEEVREEGTKR